MLILRSLKCPINFEEPQNFKILGRGTYHRSRNYFRTNGLPSPIVGPVWLLDFHCTVEGFKG